MTTLVKPLRKIRPIASLSALYQSMTDRTEEMENNSTVQSRVTTNKTYCRRKRPVISPLSNAGFSKADVRAVAEFLRLENAHKPQAACLSSRVPYGTSIDEDVLDRIERAENCLAELGFTQYRVRHHGEVARLEFIPEEMNKALAQKSVIDDQLKAFGYHFVAIDLAGFKSGSLNTGLVATVQTSS